MLDLQQVAKAKMETEPYQWVFIDRLFSPEDARRLAASFPRDHFKKVQGFDGEKSYEYMSRSMIHMGATVPSYCDGLSPEWRALAHDLLSLEYRDAISKVSGRDLASAVIEVNVVHYGPGAWMGPHVDLKEKLMTHVLYFNSSWNPELGGCLQILKSPNPSDTVAEVQPLVGNSALIVRNNHSWHSVSRVASDCLTSRRSLNVIFHQAGSVSTMWPPGQQFTLEDYAPAD